MYSNLKEVLHKRHIAIKQYAEFLGVTEKTAQNKLQGITCFTYPEFKRTCLLLPEYNADYLFQEDDDDTKQTA